MVSVKLDWAAPTEEELHTDSAAKADVEAILSSIFPQEDLYDEVVSRIAESLFNSRNEHKYLVQLYGRGNNGKTTLMRILQGAFPALVRCRPSKTCSFTASRQTRTDRARGLLRLWALGLCASRNHRADATSTARSSSSFAGTVL